MYIVHYCLCIPVCDPRGRGLVVEVKVLSLRQGVYPYFLNEGIVCIFIYYFVIFHVMHIV